MDAVYLGSTGLRVSEFALGTWRFGREDATGAVEIDKQRAFELLDVYADHGGRFIDAADRRSPPSPRVFIVLPSWRRTH